jgi:3-methyladenine DNA glycosylase/8-oxoguanine DNA glycosylase
VRNHQEGPAHSRPFWSVETPEGFRLKPVVLSHGWHQCRPFRWDADAGVLERVLRTETGIHVVTVREDEPGRLQVRVEDSERPESMADRETIEATLRRMLGFETDLTGFYERCASHETLSRVPSLGAGRLMRSPTVWEDMVRSICATNIAWSQAVRLSDRVAELGDRVGPVEAGRWAWPVPEQVAAAGADVLRETCRLGYRAPYVAELAARMQSRDLDTGPVERGEVSGDELRTFFLSVKGIGKATANFLAILYGDYEQISIDSAVYNFVGGKYFDGEKPTDAQITALYEPFGEWAALACWYDGMLSWWWPTIEADLG